MHKSRLRGFIIDCQTSNLEQAASFWSAALGMPARARVVADDPTYQSLVDPNEEINVEVQRVSHESRVHVDIETDNIEAEVARLEALGARRIGMVQTWWVMQAPTGQRFCVVRKQSARFDQRANVWPPNP